MLDDISLRSVHAGPLVCCACDNPCSHDASTFFPRRLREGGGGRREGLIKNKSKEGEGGRKNVFQMHKSDKTDFLHHILQFLQRKTFRHALNKVTRISTLLSNLHILCLNIELNASNTMSLTNDSTVKQEWIPPAEDIKVTMPPPPSRRPPPPLPPPLRNRTTNVAFTLDYNPQPQCQTSSASAMNPHPCSSSSITMPPQPERQCSSASAMNTQTSSSSSSTNMRTSAITLFDTNHGRQRRMERAIPQRHVQAAIKYGKATPHQSDPNLMIYTHKGKKHIVTKAERLLVTTMVTTVDLRPEPISEQDLVNHRRSVNIIHNQTKIPWESHSILIVDRSGSMRNSDVNGCRTRLGAVWLSIAQDFVDHRMKTGMAGALDVVSVILMGEDAQVVVDRWPTDYVLYNQIVKYFHDSVS